jgi:N-acetylglucosamine kinase-like BadF-type ATPase
MNALLDLIRRHKSGVPVGIYSVCSAHPLVLEAALCLARRTGTVALIEATSNQVNQDGGYTGMRPAGFRERVLALASAVGLPHDHVVLGGDQGPAAYLETGIEALQMMLASGIHAALAQGSLSPAELTFAFLGLPAYGEDSRLLGILDRAASPALSLDRYRCANDMVSGWAGALGGRDGINIVAGTRSIAYGEFAGRSARAGDSQAQSLFDAAAYELAALVHSVRDKLNPPAHLSLPVSYSGGMFHFGDLVLDPLRAVLSGTGREHEFAAPRMSPGAGAALYAAKLSGALVTSTAIAELTRQLGAPKADGPLP